MNSYEMLNLVEEAILEQTDRSWFRYLLVVRGDKVQCITARTQLPDDKVIYELTKMHLQHGFGSCEWSHIQRNLWNLREEIKL